MTRPILSDADRADVFRGLAHPLRRRIIKQLNKAETPVADLLTLFPVKPQTLSQHLGVLRQSGLVSQRVDGRRRIYRLSRSAINRASKWLNQLD